MARSFKIDDLIPWLRHEDSAEPQPEAIRQELLKLNVENDPGMDWVSFPDASEDSYITDFEFYKNKQKLNPTLRRLVSKFFEEGYEVYRTPITDKNNPYYGNDFVVVDDGDGLIEYAHHDYCAYINPQTGESGQMSPVWQYDGQITDLGIDNYSNIPLVQLLFLDDATKFSISDTAKIVKALPNLFTVAPENKEKLKAANEPAKDFVIEQFVNEANKPAPDPHRLQNLFIELLIMAEKGWGGDLFRAFEVLTAEEWNMVLDHPTLPIKTAHAFASAIKGNGKNPLEHYLLDIQNSNAYPFPYRLLVASALCYTDGDFELHDIGLELVKNILFEALQNQTPGGPKIITHPAFRLMALEALGTLSERNKFSDNDIMRLITFLSTYQSITEDEIKKILKPAQYDRDVRHAIDVTEQTAENNGDNNEVKVEPVLEEVGEADYGIDGMLTYWLMDYNHQIMEKAFSAILAYHNPLYIESVLASFITRDRSDEPVSTESQAYVEYYKMGEAKKALGRLYGSNEWLRTAQSDDRANDIGRGVERNPKKKDLLLSAFTDHTLQRMWDTKDRLLGKNFSVFQLVRYFLEVESKDNPSMDAVSIIDWMYDLPREKRKAILEYDFKEAPINPQRLRDVLQALDTELNQFIRRFWPEVNFIVFKNWLGWCQADYFVYRSSETAAFLEVSRQRRNTYENELASAGAEEENLLVKSWDTEDEVLSKNYIALQIARYYQEVYKGQRQGDNPLTDWWNGLGEAEKKEVLDHVFDNKPLDNFDEFVYSHSTELRALVIDESGDYQIADSLRLNSAVFQCWQNWEHFGPFIFEGLRAAKQAIKADIARKAWSWEFYGLKPQDFMAAYPFLSSDDQKDTKRRELILFFLQEIKGSTFAYYRMDLITYFFGPDIIKLGSAWDDVRKAAFTTFGDLRMPKAFVYTQLMQVYHVESESELMLALTSLEKNPQVLDTILTKVLGEHLPMESGGDFTTLNNEPMVAQNTPLARSPERVPLPSADEHGLFWPYKFESHFGRYIDADGFNRITHRIDNPPDRAPHEYHYLFRKLARRYSGDTVEYLVDLLSEKTDVHPHKHKFRYVAERNDLKNVLWWLVSNLADAIFTDHKIEKLFVNSYLHASGSKNNPFKEVMDKIVQAFLQGWDTKHQSSFVELAREFYLTYESGNPIEHLAYIAFNYVRRQYILAVLRDAAEQGYDPLVYMTQKLDDIEDKINNLTQGKPVDDYIESQEALIRSLEVNERRDSHVSADLDAQIKRLSTNLDELQLLLEQRRQALDFIVQARLGYQPEPVDLH
ncbi:hypothetical protein K1X76_07635 [bacterium]|nr:hypothetical protein [bacterium]